MKIKTELLGQQHGNNICRVIMEDGCRMQIHLCSFGASIMKILLPDRHGVLENVVLGYEAWQDYAHSPLYAGATLCPNAGRISQGRLPIDGQEFQLSRNDGRHNLHGGFANASYQIFDILSTEESDDFCAVTFYGTLADGRDGFPGNRKVQIRYLLRNQSSLEISYLASTDKATYLNPSNHSYFNLSGDFTRSALLQEVQTPATQYVANDAEHIPVSVEACSGTPFDFTDFRSLASAMEAEPDHPQLQNARGYNHAFLLPPPAISAPKKALSLKDNASGRMLTVYTDAPSLVLYSGGYIGSSHVLAGKISSSDSCAIALEAQDIPDTVNRFPQCVSITRPGEKYRRRILYQFSSHGASILT